MNRATLEVADIIRAAGDSFWDCGIPNVPRNLIAATSHDNLEHDEDEGFGIGPPVLRSRDGVWNSQGLSIIKDRRRHARFQARSWILPCN